LSLVPDSQRFGIKGDAAARIAELADGDQRQVFQVGDDVAEAGFKWELR